MSDEMILVPRAELLEWAKEWQNDYGPNDDTDCVTPFDLYLMKAPAEAVGTVLGGEFHYLRVNHGLPDGTMLYAIDQAQGDAFCDGHCTWLDHAPGCPRYEDAPPSTTEAQPVYVGVDLEGGWIRATAPEAQAQGDGEGVPIAWRTVYPDGSHSTWMDGAGHWPKTKGFAGGAHGWEYAFAPPSASVGVEDHVKALRQMWQQCANDRRMIEAAALNTAIEALAAQPAAVDGATPEGWRVTPFTGSWKACDERWEVYSPDGSGGVVLASEVRHHDVASLLDALAGQQQGGE